MYNNLPQQTPYLPYQYGMAASYPRIMATQEQPSAPAQSTQQVYVPMQNYIKGRPVVSIDEARASQIDLDGSLYVFPDIGNKKIYTKQINLDGTACFNVFSLDEAQMPTPAQPEPSQYVTKDELNEILDKFKASLAKPEAPKSKPAAPPFNL